MDFGEEADKASTFKLIGNSMIISTLEMLSETMTLADKTGVGSDRVLEWIKDFYPGKDYLLNLKVFGSDWLV
jgi:3-hydroxyisobutyrate dehydrogenase-like beta-hydroxyacid dehydrogenase